MKTYLFVDRNSSVEVILSAENEEEAKKLLESKVKYPWTFRMEEVE